MTETTEVRTSKRPRPKVAEFGDKKAGSLHQLPLCQFGEHARLLHQFVVRTPLDDLAPLHYVNAVGIHNRTQAMSDHDTCRFKRFEATGDLLLRHIIQRTGCFVEQQNLRFVDNGTGDHQALSLPTRKRAFPLGNHRVHAHRHVFDVVIQPAQFRSFPGIVQSQWRGTNDVAEDVARCQPTVLQHNANLPA